MLEQHAHSPHLEAQMRLARRVCLGVKESFADGVSADRVPVHTLAKALMALLSQDREVKMSLEVRGFLLEILEFLFQIVSYHTGQFALGLRSLVKPALRNFLILRLLQKAFAKLIESAPCDPQILAGLRRRDMFAYEVREHLPGRLPA